MRIPISRRRKGQIFWPRRGGHAEEAGIVYLLRDEFTTARAAGAVNGTTAEPSGQTRTVTDTAGTKLSISGGELLFAGTHTGAGDPGIWWTAQSRVLGKILLTSARIPSTGSVIAAGWDTNQTSIVVSGVYLTTTTEIRIISNGAQIAGVGVYAAATYSLAFILRASGIFTFIKGGAFTTWTLLYYDVLESTATMYPAISALTTTGTASAWDDIRVPANLYIPAPLAYDTFTRANGALGSTETTGPDSQVLTALAWAFTTGIWTISTNKAIATPALGADVIVNGAFAADTDWTKDAGWTIAAGVATVASAGAASIYESVGVATGAWWQAVWTLTARTSGSVQALYGTWGGNLQIAPATYTETFRALGNTRLGLNVAGASTLSVDNVSFKRLSEADLFASVLVATADVIAEAAVTLLTNNFTGLQAGLVLNLDSVSNPQNFIVCYLSGNGNVILDECVAGVYTNKLATSITYSAGAVLRVVRDGTSCRVFYNNAAVSTVQTMSINTSQNVGLFSTSALNSLDAFQVWARGTANEFSALDAY